MKLDYSSRFLREFDSCPLEIRRACDKQLEFLASNLRHPSLRAKKYDEARDVWQARVNDDWRFYFKIDGDTYYILSVSKHPK